MPHDSGTPSREDVLRTLQDCINTAKEIIPVFTAALLRNSLLHARLSGLRFALIERSNPCHLSALDIDALTELSDYLQELLHQLDGLIHKDIQKKVQRVYKPLQQRINSQLDDGQLMGRHPESTSDGEEAPGKQQSQRKGQAPNSNHQNLEVIELVLSFRCLSGSENLETLSAVTNGSIVDLDRVAQNEAYILESGELLKLAIDRAWPESAASTGDLMMAKDATLEQVDDVLVRAENANDVCDRLGKVYEVISKRLQHCKFTKHVAKFHLSEVGHGTIGFMFSRCREAQSWYPMPCRIHQSVTPQSFKTQRRLTFHVLSDTRGMPPFRDCRDFRLAEGANKCLTLNLGNDQEIFTKSVPKTSELGRAYGTVPEKFLTLKEVLRADDPDQTARATMGAGWWGSRFMVSLRRTPEEEPKKEEPDYRPALTENLAILQYLLSSSVLHLYSSPWLLDIWQPDHIEFPMNGPLLDFRRPYYPSPFSIESPKGTLLEQVTPVDSCDPAETFAQIFMAKFGLLLLQLQLQQAFDVKEEEKIDDIWPLTTLIKYSEKYEKSIGPIKEVVDACVDFRDHLYDAQDASGKSDAIRFRIVFYRFILEPLRVILLRNHPDIGIEVQNSLVRNAPAQGGLDTQPREGLTSIERNNASSRMSSDSDPIGETMIPRSRPASTEWFNKLDELNEYLTAQACQNEETCKACKTYETSRVKVAVIDSGLHQGRQGGANITYKNFIKEGKYKDDPQHGTNSVDLIRKVYGRADLYVAKVFERNEARGNTSKYMAEAIEWAISMKVDIISISAGFKDEDHDELEAQIKMATAGGAEPEILVFAAASNWQNISGVAYPASMTDRVICIFCCNGGLKPSRQWNPNPRGHAANFALLGEDVVLDSGAGPLCGTSVSTALAAGLAAKLLDFSRQPDVQSWISKANRDKMRTKAGISAILKEMSRKNVSEKYECVAPWMILPAQLGHDRKKIREAICTIIEKAME